MSLKGLAARLFAFRVRKKMNRWIHHPIQAQEKTFETLIKTAKNTSFGIDHDFKNIKSHADFVRKIPVRDYEALRGYVDRVVAGEADILWPGKPLYFAKTSGTTSGAKYIPLTRESMPTHVKAARNAILSYIWS